MSITAYRAFLTDPDASAVYSNKKGFFFLNFNCAHDTTLIDSEGISFIPKMADVIISLDFLCSLRKLDYRHLEEIDYPVVDGFCILLRLVWAWLDFLYKALCWSPARYIRTSELHSYFVLKLGNQISLGVRL